MKTMTIGKRRIAEARDIVEAYRRLYIYSSAALN
jgi:hypothetical protein